MMNPTGRLPVLFLDEKIFYVDLKVKRLNDSWLTKVQRRPNHQPEQVLGSRARPHHFQQGIRDTCGLLQKG